ncbi:Gfo/Idh/MocA family protein [Candidatus Pseudothioglobus sp. Uisw_086]|jgi:predicted dehydrogenase|uniref:Gfo/Idh/MocA family protein n=1 Tax=Candidatus Pseudothioglobus sp. Uisw_086 TaxID=3230998 RepID=UPI003A835AE9
MKKVKIYGAGSIGNHLAQASRRMDWSVDICDIDHEALNRTKNEIYPSRYDDWDNQINLYNNDQAPVGGYDLIIIGTPPDSHMKLARSAVREGAKAVLVEKPLCSPDLNGAQELFDEARKANCLVFVGYDHAISKSALKMSNSLQNEAMGEIYTLDVEFREYWGGIFQAHPWLDGPSDSYLGYWEKGGGACGEHSHAINLFQCFAHESGIGRVNEVSASMDYIKEEALNYDSICLMNLKTEQNVIGRVVQDVITKPTRKWARAQCENGYLEWFCGNKPGVDSVIYGKDNIEVKVEEILKTRPDDFFQELQHISSVLENNELYNKSPIKLERGLETMLVIAAAHHSAQNNCPVTIDYSKGYSLKALSF